MKILFKDVFFCWKEKLFIGEVLGKISSCWIKKVFLGSLILILGEEVINWYIECLFFDIVVEVVGV